MFPEVWWFKRCKDLYGLCWSSRGRPQAVSFRGGRGGLWGSIFSYMGSQGARFFQNHWVNGSLLKKHLGPLRPTVSSTAVMGEASETRHFSAFHWWSISDHFWRTGHGWCLPTLWAKPQGRDGVDIHCCCHWRLATWIDDAGLKCRCTHIYIYI